MTIHNRPLQIMQIAAGCLAVLVMASVAVVIVHFVAKFW